MSTEAPVNRPGHVSRRDVVRILSLSGISVLGGTDLRRALAVGIDKDPWRATDAILARIRAPTFPSRDFEISRFGAVGDGTTDCTHAIRQAIKACQTSGGGRIIVPSGRFLTGPIHLESNINLHLANTDSVLAFHTDPKAYLPVVLTRWEGNDCYNYSPLIYAYEKENIGITGKGSLDGQASRERWWPWTGKGQWGWQEGQPSQKAGSTRLRQQGGAAPRPGLEAFAQDPVSERVFGDGWYLRPNFVEPYRCRNVLIDGITITNAPFWLLHPLYCTNVIIRNYTAASLGANNDGCNPESCIDVLIEDCTFDTGDDCIALKAGRGLDGLRNLLANDQPAPCQDIIVRRCTFVNGHGALTVGSEMSGGVRNIFADGLSMTSPLLYFGLRFKTNSFRGGRIENIYIKNIRAPAGIARRAISIDYFYEEGKDGPFRPEVTDIFVSNMTVGANPDPASKEYAIYLRGYESDPTNLVGRIEVSDSSFVAKGGNVIEAVRDLVMSDVMLNGRKVGNSPL